ncbi:MAG TPA: hypothetical protein VFO99_13975 [Pyrinomonadaceae bacterium]|nr:hypothetical protein [Pyrinomonadaceae bacterium]
MRNRIWALLICVHCLAFGAAAQSPAKRQLVLPVANGGFVAFRSETSGPGSAQMKENSLSALLFAQAVAGEDRVIHRVLTDADRRVVFAYDLAINSDPVTKKFSLAVLPADEAFRRSFLKDSAPLRAHEGFATFPKSTTPQTLDDGDAVSLELLVNRELDVKIVDVVKVTFDRSLLRENYLDAPPKDFTLDAVSLAVKSYELTIDGTLVGKSKSKIGCAGSLLWIYIPDRGRFIFSLVPRDGYSFQKIGLLDDNRIEFEVDGEFYEWTSGDSILASGGVWHLWVLHDPEYTPFFGAQKSAPAFAQKRPNVLEKLEDRLLTRQGITLLRNGGSGKPRQNIDTPQRVIIGGADNIENLLPKNP